MDFNEGVIDSDNVDTLVLETINGGKLFRKKKKKKKVLNTDNAGKELAKQLTHYGRPVKHLLEMSSE